MKISTFFFAAFFALVFLSACTGLTEEIPTPQSSAAENAPTTITLPSPESGPDSPRPSRRATVRACDYRGIVTEMRGRYDCEFVISLENGDRIVPVQIDRDFFNLYDGQLVSLSYRPTNIRIGCQRGTPAIVTCIQEL